MKRFFNWIKARLARWVAPDYVARLEETDRALHDVATMTTLIEAIRRENETMRQSLRRPFEARETECAPPWGNEDAEHWRRFLAGQTGTRLAQLVNYWTQVEAQKATLRPDRHEYACGLAAGWLNEGDFLLNRLSADLPLQTEGDTEQGQGAAGYRERVAP